MARVCFDLSAQTVNYILEQHLIAAPVSAPDGLDNIIHAKNMCGTTHEQEQ
jgi:hypothetical protein